MKEEEEIKEERRRNLKEIKKQDLKIEKLQKELIYYQDSYLQQAHDFRELKKKLDSIKCLI